MENLSDAERDPFVFSPTRHCRLLPNVRYHHKDLEFDYR